MTHELVFVRIHYGKSAFAATKKKKKQQGFRLSLACSRLNKYAHERTACSVQILQSRRALTINLIYMK